LYPNLKVAAKHGWNISPASSSVSDFERRKQLCCNPARQ